MTEKEAKENLFHLRHINTYLDLNKEEFKIKNETLIKWSESTDTVIQALEQKDKEIDSWKKYSNEQEESIVEKSNKICDMEFKIEKQQKALEQKDQEIADVLVMLEQFKLYYNIKNEDIEKIMDYKIDRQIKRIEKAREENEK